MDYQATVNSINAQYQEAMRNLQQQMRQEQEALRRTARNPYQNPYQQPAQETTEQTTTLSEAPAQPETIPVPMQQLAVLGTISATMEKLVSLIEERFPAERTTTTVETTESTPDVITFTEEDKNVTPKTTTDGTTKTKK